MRPTTFIAMLFCMCLACTILGIGNLYEVGNFKFNGKSAVMQLAPSQKKIRGSVADFSTVPLDVMYTGEAGNVLVPQKQLDGQHAQKLLDGGKIPVIYLPKNPQRIIYFVEDLPNPWGWLIVAIASAGLFLYALRQLRRENAKSA